MSAQADIVILYTLACDSAHRFESWFPSSAAFDDQAAAGLVTCPNCGSQQVAKAIMAPAVLGERRPEIPVSAEPAVPAAQDVALLDRRQQEIRALIKDFRTKVLAEAQNVGTRFPEEARRMHLGEAPVRQIHGQATAREALDLIEDGIMVMPLPVLPDELN